MTNCDKYLNTRRVFIKTCKGLGLSEDQGIAVVTLSGYPNGTSVGVLCDNLACRPAQLCRIQDALESRGFITREIHEHDRRMMTVNLTKSGHIVATALHAILNK